MTDGRFTVVETGFFEGDLTRGAADALHSGARVVLRTERCGCARYLQSEGIAYSSLDGVYERAADFDEVTRACVRTLIGLLSEGDVVYGVMDLRDETVSALIDAGTSMRVVGGGAEGALRAYADGKTLCVCAGDWADAVFHADENALIREIDTRELACELKLKLMECYPEESEILIKDASGELSRARLDALDRLKAYDHRVCVFVRAEKRVSKLERYDFSHLTQIVERLRDPDGGCPWDRAQTHETLKSAVVQEAYEVADAITRADDGALCEELGDLILSVVMHAQIAREHGNFTVADCLTAACEKMIRRHAGIFSENRALSPEAVEAQWEAVKRAERGQTTVSEAMRSVSTGLPALTRASKVYKLSSHRDIGFDGGSLWRDMQTLTDAGVDPETSLHDDTERFIRVFSATEGK